MAFSMSTSHAGKRARTSSSAMTPSIRASAAPMQRWMPLPNVRCRPSFRWMSKLSPLGKRRSSRLAEPSRNSITLPAGTSVPWTTRSCLATHRPDVGRRRFVAQDLLNGIRDQRGIGDELGPLVGMIGQDLGGPADQAGRGLVPGAGEHLEVRQQLVARQLAHRVRLVGELDVQELGHDVVRGMLGPPVDVVGEHGAGHEVLRDLHRLARLGAEVGVHVVADRFLVALGNAEEHADHLHRHLGAQIGDEVEAVRSHRAGRG